MCYLFPAVIAIAGLIVSVICNLMGWLSIEPSWGRSLSTLQTVMFIGILSLLVPLIILAERTKSKTGRGNLEHLFGELPKWARIASVVLAVYATLNYAMIRISHHPWPGWHQLSVAVQLRGFSGHWMVFCGLALAGFVALTQGEQKEKEKAVGGNH